MMTDNRTTELLRKLLDERGVEYLTDDDERAYDEPMRTTWDFVLCGYEMTVTATEFVDIEGKTYLEMDFHHAFTPEQAVVATLGDDEYESKMDALLCRLTNGKWSKTRFYDLDFMESCVDEEFEDLYAKELAYATLGNGTLTAEQVRDVFLENFEKAHETSYDLWEPSTFNWQAITDGLNARAERTCRNDSLKKNSGVFVCSECGVYLDIADMDWDGEDDSGGFYEPRFCPNCGARNEEHGG